MNCPLVRSVIHPPAVGTPLAGVLCTMQIVGTAALGGPFFCSGSISHGQKKRWILRHWRGGPPRAAVPTRQSTIDALRCGCVIWCCATLGCGNATGADGQIFIFCSWVQDTRNEKQYQQKTAEPSIHSEGSADIISAHYKSLVSVLCRWCPADRLYLPFPPVQRGERWGSDTASACRTRGC